MHQRFPVATTCGLIVVLLTVLVGILGSDLVSATAFLGFFLFGTGMWHGVRGGSWVTPLMPQGRKVGAASMAVGLVVMVMAGFATPATGTDSPIAPSTSTSPSSPSLRRPSSSVDVDHPMTTTSPAATTATPVTPTSLTPASASPASADSTSNALTVLKTLVIKGRAPRTGYSRDQFGQRWADTDRNGCDTRNDILRRDLTNLVSKPGTRDCVILSGTLQDPYTGTVIDFMRGEDTSSEVQIDHVVALSDAWQKGGQQQDADTRTLFGNDPLNLLAVQGRANQQKGVGDAATWLPANKQFRCPYVARQVAVKERYGLWVTQAEHDAIDRILQGCPDQLLPSEPAPSDPPTEPAQKPTAHSPMPTPTAATTGGDVRYPNCAAAREAGAAPILRGEPGYRSGLDGDNDGVACE